MLGCVFNLKSQEVELHEFETTNSDTIIVMDDLDGRIMLVDDSVSYTKEKEKFKPNPAKATWCAVLFPGAGQIYNRKYWKLPIVYGGFVGLGFAISINNQKYVSFKKAYGDLIDSDPTTNSYEYFTSRGYSQSSIKNSMNIYRRYRDLSIAGTVVVYALSIIDAFVDAQLFDYDISTNLSAEKRTLHVEPIIMTEQTHNTKGIGVYCNFVF